MSNKKEKRQKKSGLWAFLTQNTRSPTTYEVFMSLARAEYLLEKVRAIYRQQENFEKQTERINHLKGIIKALPPDDFRHKLAVIELNKILKI